SRSGRSANAPGASSGDRCRGRAKTTVADGTRARRRRRVKSDGSSRRVSTRPATIRLGRSRRATSRRNSSSRATSRRGRRRLVPRAGGGGARPPPAAGWGAGGSEGGGGGGRPPPPLVARVATRVVDGAGWDFRGPIRYRFGNRTSLPRYLKDPRRRPFELLFDPFALPKTHDAARIRRGARALSTRRSGARRAAGLRVPRDPGRRPRLGARWRLRLARGRSRRGVLESGGSLVCQGHSVRREPRGAGPEAPLRRRGRGREGVGRRARILDARALLGRPRGAR